MATKPNQARIYKQVPTLLFALRERAGLTQRQLAKRIGRTQWWVHRNETGDRRVDVAEFVLICNGCGVKPADVLNELAGVKGGLG